MKSAYDDLQERPTCPYRGDQHRLPCIWCVVIELIDVFNAHTHMLADETDNPSMGMLD